MSRATSFFRTSDGMPVTEDEACPDGVLRSGYGMRAGAVLRDAAGNLINADDGQTAYELRVSQAWCDHKPSPLTERWPLPHGRTRTAPLNEDQDRLSDALKQAD